MSVLKRAALTPLCPAGHLPLKGGDRLEARSSRHSIVLRWARRHRQSISPLEGEIPGRAEGGPQPNLSGVNPARGSTPR
ncbi:lytic murein transglycosylase [Agrobacterium cavarae]|uniref:Lytic murein transglycosylase n=1 Tax=Agrobacterium cavarae TaxID=2528239 RepID=A0ABY1Y6K7_9HYPH|nr:lytic murein transglycosylase [Agrobacterium cavarae]